MGQTRTHDSTAPLGVKAICVFVALSAGIAFFSGLRFAVQATDHGLVLGAILVVLALLETVTAQGLSNLKPWSW